MSTRTWLSEVLSHPDALTLRSDSHATLRAVALALSASCAADGTSSPGWSQMQRRADVSRASVARWLRWLRQRGLIATARPGGPDEQAAYVLVSRTEDA